MWTFQILVETSLKKNPLNPLESVNFIHRLGFMNNSRRLPTFSAPETAVTSLQYFNASR